MRFYTKNFLSKWGFNDGDADNLDDLLHNNEKKYPDIIKYNICSRELMIKIAYKELLPKIKNNFKFLQYDTIHNELRFEEIDGENVDQYNTEFKPKIPLEPEYIDVSEERIIEILEEIIEYKKNKEILKND